MSQEDKIKNQRIERSQGYDLCKNYENTTWPISGMGHVFPAGQECWDRMLGSTGRKQEDRLYTHLSYISDPFLVPEARMESPPAEHGFVAKHRKPEGETPQL
jgi:hypothetical protein